MANSARSPSYPETGSKYSGSGLALDSISCSGGFELLESDISFRQIDINNIVPIDWL